MAIVERVRIAWLALFIGFLLFAPAAVAADRKVALVIGNSDYADVAMLPNPVNDANAISASLKRLDFEVTLIENATKAEFEQALGDFSERASVSDLALVFYAGHGIEMDGINYLIPTDAKLKTDRRVPLETVSLGNILDAISGARKLRIVLLDACRNNPFTQKISRSAGSKRSIGRGLADVKAGPNELISYATFAGTEAADGVSEHSPYTEALLANIEKPGIEIGKLFRIVAEEVQVKTNGEQVPYESARLPAIDIFLHDPETATDATGTTDTGGSNIRTDWELAKGSGNADVLKAFIETHGDNAFYRALAEKQLALLQKPARPETATEVPVTECDRLAASPDSRKKPASIKGVQFAAIKSERAIPACEEAVQTYPKEARFVFQLGRAYEKAERYETALVRYRQAADLGEATAMTSIGALYYTGLGVTQDYREAMNWYRRAADLGEAGAMTKIGELYGNGHGVTRDYQEAMIWFRRAVDLGNAKAMANFGFQYDNGWGVEANFGLAAEWYYKALAAKHEETLSVIRFGASYWNQLTREAFQSRLKNEGLYRGDVDGKFGKSTIEGAEKVFNGRAE